MIRHVEFRIAGSDDFFQVSHTAFNNVVNRYVLDADRFAADPREVDQRTDELPHLAGGRSQPVQLVPPLRVQPRRLGLNQRFGKARYTSQRGSQIVRHRVDERFQIFPPQVKFQRKIPGSQQGFHAGK